MTAAETEKMKMAASNTRGWVDLPNLNDIFREDGGGNVGGIRSFTDEDAKRIAETVLPFLRRWAAELRIGKHMWRHSDFTRSVARRLDWGQDVSPAQLRGVLNVIAAAIRAQRKAAWDNPYAQNRRERGWYECGSCGCIICGDLLTTEIDRARGVGRTCWRNLVAAPVNPPRR